MFAIEVANVSKRFGDLAILRGVSCAIAPGEFYFLLGPSGCGKTTLFRIIAGLEHPDSGEVRLDGRVVNDLPPHRRGIGMVFQHYALWPHMTVEQNIAFGLEMRGVRGAERRSRVGDALEMVRLPDLAARYPHQLSGGQQQRVAVARALVTRPSIVLLDEPLSNLDSQLREEIGQELSELQRALKVTMVYVTHEQEDALARSSRLAIMHEGRIIQEGPAEHVYTHPVNRFAASFLGEANLLPCQVRGLEGGRARVQLKDLPLREIAVPTHAAVRAGDQAWVCVRPEHIGVNVDSGNVKLSGRVIDRTFRGSYWELAVQVAEPYVLRVKSHVDRVIPPGVGETANLAWRDDVIALISEAA